MENLFFDTGRIKYLGVGVIIGKSVRIRKPEDTIIGDYSIIDDFTYISCALEIGRHCHIASNVNLSGGAGKIVMRNFVGIASGCSIHAASSDYLTASLDLPSVPEEMRFGGVVEDILLDDHVLLGSHTVVLPGVYLPEGVATTALTVLRKKDFIPWTLYGGFDGKKLFSRNHSKLDQKLEIKQ